MFDRRTRPRLLRRLQCWLWPAMGVRRTLLYHLRRLQRLPDSPTRIAAGFATGVAMAISPVVGTHMVSAMAVARILRANIVAAVIGTLVINPWTAPPVWLATYYLGRLMEGLPVLGRANAPPFIAMFKGLTEAVLRRDLDLFAAQVWPVLKPMLLGSIPLGIMTGFVVYAVFLPMLCSFQGRRTSRYEKPPPPTPAG